MEAMVMAALCSAGGGLVRTASAYLVLTACWVLLSWATDADPSNPPTTSEACATVLIYRLG